MKPSGEEYYKYFLSYVDGILHLAHDPKEDIDALNITNIFKYYILGTPERCLGANV